MIKMRCYEIRKADKLCYTTCKVRNVYVSRYIVESFGRLTKEILPGARRDKYIPMT